MLRTVPAGHISHFLPPVSVAESKIKVPSAPARIKLFNPLPLIATNSLQNFGKFDYNNKIDLLSYLLNPILVKYHPF
jgi:hypothetical protein